MSRPTACGAATLALVAWCAGTPAARAAQAPAPGMALALLAPASTEPGATLALVMRPAGPQLFLAQRQIERSWGQSEDSVYKEIDVPGWRSEGTSIALSALVPGAGQVYTGEPKRAWLYALAEVAGWTSRWIYLRRGHDLQDDAAAYAGTPVDSTSRWSFTRWQNHTDGDAAELRALFDRDRNVFYDRIAHDPSLLAGWAGNSTATRGVFTDLRDHADDRLRYGRYAGAGVWINHVVSAVDALRAARLHNIALGPRLNLGMKSGWSHGGPTFAMAVKGSF